MVCYEIYMGTVKYLSHPVATTTYSTEVELPSVSLCQYRSSSYKIGRIPPFNLTFEDYLDGKFFPDINITDAEAENIFQNSFNDNYYLLDVRGSYLDWVHLTSKQREEIRMTFQRRPVTVDSYLKMGSYDEFTLER